MVKYLKIKNNQNKKNFKKKLKIYLRKLNINKQDTLLIHSDISILKNFGNTLNLRDMLEIFVKTLKQCVGKRGTLVFPAYYYEFQKKKIFDLKSSISKELGILPKYINSLKDSYRSINPLTSAVAIGYNAEKICNNTSLSSYGFNSPFDNLTKLSGKMLFFGTNLSVMTYVHYAEFLLGVPHRYNKYVKIKIKDKNNKIYSKNITIYVRYRDINVINDPKGNYNKFKNLKTLIVKSFKKKKSYIINIEEIFNHLINNVSKNYFYLLRSKPDFKN